MDLGRSSPLVQVKAEGVNHLCGKSPTHPPVLASCSKKCLSGLIGRQLLPLKIPLGEMLCPPVKAITCLSVDPSVFYWAPKSLR